MGGFNIVVGARRLAFVPSRPAKMAGPTVVQPWLSAMPHFLIGLDGSCFYASPALGTLLQCAVTELSGLAWRQRLDPRGAEPLDLDALRDHARDRQTWRLYNDYTNTAIVTRIRRVMKPGTTTATGYFGMVSVVRIHRTQARATA